MANASVSGLVSGLDTTSIINQLMQLEAQPQTNLKNRVSGQQAIVTALQAINGKLAGIATKATDLTKLANWTPSTATSSNSKVTVTADPGAAASQLGFTVQTVASSYRATYATAATASAAPMAANAPYTVTFGDGSVFNFDTGDGSLGAIAAKLNASGSGLDAALVRVGTDATTGQDTYVLNVQAESTGAKSKFTIAPTGTPSDTTSFLGGTGSSSGGDDAAILIDGQSTPLTSSTNTFTDVMPGVDVTLQAGATGPTTITVARDAKGMSDSVKALVDAVNSVLDDIDKQTAYDPVTKKSGALAADPLLRNLRDQLASAVADGMGGTSFADVGVQVDRNGNLVFDEAKFQSAYAANPTGVAAKFTDGTTPTRTSGSTHGLASTLAWISKAASDSVAGTVTLSITGRTSEITGLQGQIADWDVRLQLKREALQRQYGALEVALGKLQDQGTWLAGQIGSLPKMSG